MFSLLRNLFKKKQTKVHNYSTTLTTTYEGVKSKKELSPEILQITQDVEKDNAIRADDLNKLIAFYFNIKPITPGIYNLNKELADRMCFAIAKVRAVYDENDDIEDVDIDLVETTFNLNFHINISVKDFHEVFKNLTFSSTSKDIKHDK